MARPTNARVRGRTMTPEEVCKSKRKWPNRKQALTGRNRSDSAFVRSLVPYHCSVCHDWHLTKKDNNA